MSAFGDARPLAARRRHDINGGDSGLGRFESVKTNPALIWRKAWLPESVLRVGSHHAHLVFRMRRGPNREHADQESPRTMALGIAEDPLSVSGPIVCEFIKPARGGD